MFEISWRLRNIKEIAITQPSRLRRKFCLSWPVRKIISSRIDAFYRKSSSAGSLSSKKRSNIRQKRAFVECQVILVARIIFFIMLSRQFSLITVVRWSEYIFYTVVSFGRYLAATPPPLARYKQDRQRVMFFKLSKFYLSNFDCTYCFHKKLSCFKKKSGLSLRIRKFKK